MIGCLRTRVRNQPIIALYFESENVLKLYNLEACAYSRKYMRLSRRRPLSKLNTFDPNFIKLGHIV